MIDLHNLDNKNDKVQAN